MNRGKASSFSRCGFLHPSLGTARHESVASRANKRGRRSADRRVVKSRATRCDVTAATRCGRGARHGRSGRPNRPLRARSPLGAPPRLSSRGFRLRAIRSRPRFTRPGGPGVTRSSVALKPSTWLADRSVGGVVTRTARERGYKPRPQEPLPPHQSAVAGDTPHGRDCRDIVQNCDVCQLNNDSGSA